MILFDGVCPGRKEIAMKRKREFSIRFLIKIKANRGIQLICGMCVCEEYRQWARHGENNVGVIYFLIWVFFTSLKSFSLIKFVFR